MTDGYLALTIKRFDGEADISLYVLFPSGVPRVGDLYDWAKEEGECEEPALYVKQVRWFRDGGVELQCESDIRMEPDYDCEKFSGKFRPQSIIEAIEGYDGWAIESRRTVWNTHLGWINPCGCWDANCDLVRA